jgi:hypothetical protein
MLDLVLVFEAARSGAGCRERGDKDAGCRGESLEL